MSIYLKKISIVTLVFLIVFSHFPRLGVSANQEELEAGWSFRAFGGNTSEERNPPPVIHEDGSVTMTATGGKIASGDEGLSFMYQELPHDVNFTLHASVDVQHFNSNQSVSTPNQKSFGLMVRDAVGEDGDSAVQTANYVANGALDTVMKGFYKEQGVQTKLTPFSSSRPPISGETYELSITKSGDAYLLTANEESEVVLTEGNFDETLFAGFYVARDAEVTFRDFSLVIDNRVVEQLIVDDQDMKKDYFVGEPFDPTGLLVTARFMTGEEQTLSPDDYFWTGFSSAEPGARTLTIHYLGATETIELKVHQTAVEDLAILYYPAKTTYYLGDHFDREGLVVIATLATGERQEVPEDDYFLSLDGEVIDESFTFSRPGELAVDVTLKEDRAMSTSFAVEVRDAAVTHLELYTPPEKQLYFIGEELKMDGAIVYAHYSDQSRVRLLRGEYDVSKIDSSTSGMQKVTITYKGVSASFTVEVKEREIQELTIVRYPKTTYTVGEALALEGLEIGYLFDNGDVEKVSEDEYEVDVSAYNQQQTGVYDLFIHPLRQEVASIVLPVTVREEIEYEWKSIRFGQSTSNARNVVNDFGDGTVELIALEGGGKVTGDHDGITFYYTELDAVEDNFTLSADVRVKEYAKNPHDGQESFGVMARDVIGPANDASVFASNIAAVGGYSGGTREANGTQLFVRTGVLASDGEGSKGIQKKMLDQEKPRPETTHPEASYRLTLKKTNSGFIGALNDGKEELFFTPDIVNVQDSKMYIGFYTARLATIEVSNIELEVTAAATDFPKQEPPEEPTAPELDILSLSRVSKTDYELIVRANVGGSLTIKKGNQTIEENLNVEKGEMMTVPTTVASHQKTNFSLSFIPDDTQLLTSYDRIVRNFTVTMKTFNEEGDLYVSPDGTSDGDGTRGAPLDLDTAIDFIMEGQTIVVLDGHYVRDSKLEINKYNDGTPDAMKALVAEPGTRPIIDFDRRSEGVILSGNYWHIKGLDFTRSAGNTKGFTVGGSHNIVENSRFYENGDTGLQISRTDGSEHIADWPSYNLILNSTSFDNRDPSENNADGFAAKLTVGVGNVFRGCIAHNNIDDGWDLYTKVGTGAIGPVLIEDSIAYNNGFLTDGTVGAGDKNGFKLGGEGIRVPHIIRGSMAFGNGAYGFTSNSNPGVIAEQNIAFNNGGGNLDFTTYPNIQPDFTIDGFISYQHDASARDRYPEELASDRNFLFNGQYSENKNGVRLTDANFKSLEPTIPYERDDAGNIIWGDFLSFIPPGEEDEEKEIIEANVSFSPPIFLLATGRGKGVALVTLALPGPYKAKDIDVSSLILNGEVTPVRTMQTGNRMMLKFQRSDLARVLERGHKVEIQVTGMLQTGESFVGTTHIFVK
ncbi:bacterial Ig-like domain-containing protein [Halalkalibacterium halodurans]|uniref:Exopolygalacturonate lyase n=1 Tax=Halalkalibacterium halodurans TaxID=86665 RepID=A0A0M0KF13_ALKHA|nr:bacterial Ig-like domain-containing protein [Halalkalibacterium halodurans]TPE69805.1 exopolygalacturonate lyase [Halalkalibacterium halodurans]